MNTKDTNKKNAEAELSELDILKKERDDFKNKYLRALADYQNYERRSVQMRDEVTRNSKSAVLSRIIPFLDNLEKAELFIKDSGLKMIRTQFQQVLNELGLEEIDVLNKEFDPHIAEAIEVVPGDKDNIVVEVLQKGYQMTGKVLRPAQVKVSKKEINS